VNVGSSGDIARLGVGVRTNVVMTATARKVAASAMTTVVRPTEGCGDAAEGRADEPGDG